MQEWQKHIRHTHADKTRTAWCGESLGEFDWVFQDIDHAAYSIQQETTTQPCPDCLKAIANLLTGN